LTFVAPTATLAPLLLVIESLIKKLFGRPEMRGRYARLAVLEAQILNRPPWVKRIHFKTSLGDTSRTYFVIRSSLENLVLPGPIEDISITLKELTGEAGRQESLFRDVRRIDQLRETVAQLKVTQGHNPIYQVREIEPWSRIPERQAALVPYEP